MRTIQTPVAIAMSIAAMSIFTGQGVPASAAPPKVRVDCATADLQDAIDNAPPGATLSVTGTCTGPFPFTVGKDLSLVGRDTAELKGGVAITSNVTVNLTNLTITGIGGPSSIRNDSGTVIVRSSTMTGSHRGGLATGIENSGTVTLYESLITGSSGCIGGIYNSGTVTLNDSPITNNVAGDIHCGIGGGIFNVGMAILNDSPVTGNASLRGGGGGIYNSGTVTLNDSPVTDNYALAGGGGGILNSGIATLSDSPVTRNHTIRVPGGGIYNGGTVTLNDSPVTDNYHIERIDDSFIEVPDNCAPPDSVIGCAD